MRLAKSIRGKDALGVFDASTQARRIVHRPVDYEQHGSLMLIWLIREALAPVGRIGAVLSSQGSVVDSAQCCIALSGWSGRAVLQIEAYWGRSAAFLVQSRIIRPCGLNVYL